MRISLKWLKQFVKITLSPEELAEKLTMAGFEVEAIEHQADPFRGFVVGEVREVWKHPNATKLSLCRVDAGNATIQVVCGAPNVKAGQKVAVGLEGAVVPHNQHDPSGMPFRLTTTLIRGEKSEGMICSEFELGLGEDRDGILILGADSALVGTPLSDFLRKNDTILDIGVTPNRPDALSHIGIAREVAALSGKKIKYPSVKLVEIRQPARKMLKIAIEDRVNCTRYSARVIRNVTVGPSPAWLTDILTSLGIRPINNVVDVTNYVLMESGQPLHAFDYEKIRGQEIRVRMAHEGEKLVTLDGKVRTFVEGELLIADANGPLAIAGIMGGAESEISHATNTVVIESAHFNSRSIRRTAKRLSLSTEASQRFERGADPAVTVRAADRAAELIRMVAGGEILKGAMDVRTQTPKSPKVLLRVDRANTILGTNLNAETVRKLLECIDFQVQPVKQKKGNGWQFTCIPPTFRPDIQREIDVVEEIARLYGYDKIETGTRSAVILHTQNQQKPLKNLVTEALVGSGFREILSNSMQDRSIAGWTTDEIVEITNPISVEMSALRTSMIPSLLSIVRHNIFHGSKNLRLFEVGRIYGRHLSPNEKSVSKRAFFEEEKLIVGISGLIRPISWDEKVRMVDLFDLKGEIESLLEKISLDKINFIPYSNAKALTQPTLAIEINGESVGMMGEVRKDILQRFEIEQPVFVAEVATATIKAKRTPEYLPLPRFPSVSRDIAIVVDSDVPVGSIESVIRNSGSSHLKHVDLFDVYAGDQVPAGKKSCAFALEFQSEVHTFSQEEIEHLMRDVVSALERSFDASVRK